MSHNSVVVRRMLYSAYVNGVGGVWSRRVVDAWIRMCDVAYAMCVAENVCTSWHMHLSHSSHCVHKLCAV